MRNRAQSCAIGHAVLAGSYGVLQIVLILVVFVVFVIFVILAKFFLFVALFVLLFILAAVDAVSLAASAPSAAAPIAPIAPASTTALPTASAPACTGITIAFEVSEHCQRGKSVCVWPDVAERQLAHLGGCAMGKQVHGARTSCAATSRAAGAMCATRAMRAVCAMCATRATRAMCAMCAITSSPLCAVDVAVVDKRPPFRMRLPLLLCNALVVLQQTFRAVEGRVVRVHNVVRRQLVELVARLPQFRQVRRQLLETCRTIFGRAEFRVQKRKPPQYIIFFASRLRNLRRVIRWNQAKQESAAVFVQRYVRSPPNPRVAGKFFAVALET